MKFIQIARPYIDKDDKAGVMEVLNSGFLSLGPKYKQFEEQMAKFVGSKYALAVSSGTAGLHLAVKALGIQEGDEVITTPYSFIASSNCILFEKAKPVFVDIEEETFNLDPDKIEAVITKKTKAILVAHIFGQSADMGKIMKIARKHNLKVIEDACESLGAKFNGKMTGTFGDIGVYSFYPNKQITTGEGGIIVTDNQQIFEYCDSLRNQGRGLGVGNKGKAWNWLVSEQMGYNYRMDEMSASLGLTQLNKFKWMVEKRIELANWYTSVLSKEPKVITPKVMTNRNHTWFVYVVRIMEGKRDIVMDKLNNTGIQVRPYFPAIHLQPFMRKMFEYKKGDFPIAEKVSAETLALPFFIGLSKRDVSYIAKNLLESIHE